jgi:RimJ/RimL family protein N-acetyltransferase
MSNTTASSRKSTGHRASILGPRSDGVLDVDQIAYCKAAGIPLAYDPVQIGIVPLECEDDISPSIDQLQDANRPAMTQASFGRAIVLRPWRSEEATLLAEMLSDPLLWRYLPEGRPAEMSVAVARDLLEIINKGRHHLVAAVEIEGRPVGQVRLLFDGDNEAPESGEISYWFDRRVWGQRIGSRAVTMFTQRCFADFSSLTSIWARVHCDNEASSRLLARVGYQSEGSSNAAMPWIRYHITRDIRVN